MFKNIFIRNATTHSVSINSNYTIIISNPEGDKSTYIYLRDLINDTYSLLIEWKQGKWDYSGSSRERADMFFKLVKKHKSIYPNFIKKIFNERNIDRTKITM